MPTVTRRALLGTSAGIVAVAAVGTVFAYRQSSLGTPVTRTATTTPPVAGMLVGGRVRRAGSTVPADFAWGQTQWGLLQVTRDYMGARTPTVYQIQFPPSCQVVLSFDTAATLTPTFVASMTPRRTVFRHEPERPTEYGGTPTGGTTFRADLAAFQTKMRALDPTVLVGHAASGYAYRGTHAGANGSYIIGSTADFFTFDGYRAGTDYKANAVIPLQNRAEFQKWYTYVKATGKPWGVTEFGAGRCNEPGLVPTIVADRVSATQSSVNWCRANGAFCFSYFFSDVGPDGHNWMPTDAAFATMYQGLTRA